MTLDWIDGISIRETEELKKRNFNTEKIAENIDDAREAFGNSCIYLNGEMPTGIESTIIDLTKDTPKIIRIGALYGDTLEDILGH